jgi:hypothetical protein
MMAGECSVYEGQENRIQGFGGKPERKRPLVRSRCRWKNNIKLDF